MGGGAERVLVNLANYFSEQGIKVDLVLSRYQGPLLRNILPSVKVVNLNAYEAKYSKSWKLPLSFSSLTSLPKLISYLKDVKPHALLAASHFSNEIAILAKHLAGVSTRVIVSERVALSLQAQQVEQSSGRLAPFTSKILYRWSDAITAVSKGVAADLNHITGIPLEKIKVIYNPVITPELIDKSQKAPAHRWFISGQPPIILGTGRFVKQKDFPTLIRAFAQIQEQLPCRLMILGAGREKRSLLSLINELKIEHKVALPGFVNNPSAYMSKASVFVLSSAWEGLPAVLIEAMAVGTPVVATNCPSGPYEILDGGKYGKLVDVGDYTAMAQAITEVLLGNHPKIEQTWLEQFTRENATKEYAEVLALPLT